MALYTQYDVVGKKEDVSDIISNISPTKTPFQSMIGSEKVSNVLFQWQEDALANVAVNAKVEGADASDATLVATTMRSNYTQILSKTILVSDTNDAVSKYGRAKESAYQMAKVSAEIKRDLEHALVGITQAAVAGNSSTARRMASATNQIAAGNITDRDAAANTEADVLTGLQDCYTAGSDPSILMVTPTDSLVVADFAKATGRLREIENGTADRKIVNAVDLYVSPFGEVKVVLNRFLEATVSLIFEPDMWKLAVLRPWTRETLAKTGDATKMMIIGEYSLKHKNQLASAALTHN
jgi:hypothetical protein